MFCKYCGNELPLDVRFCIKCGKRIEHDDISKNPGNMQDNNDLSAEDQKEIKSIYRKAIFTFLAVLIVILIVVFIAVYIKTQPHIDMDQFLN